MMQYCGIQYVSIYFLKTDLFKVTEDKCVCGSSEKKLVCCNSSDQCNHIGTFDCIRMTQTMERHQCSSDTVSRSAYQIENAQQNDQIFHLCCYLEQMILIPDFHI